MRGLIKSASPIFDEGLNLFYKASRLWGSLRIRECIGVHLYEDWFPDIPDHFEAMLQIRE